MFKRIVNGLELLALAGAVAFVVLLFANEPGSFPNSSTTNATAPASARSSRPLTIRLNIRTAGCPQGGT